MATPATYVSYRFNAAGQPLTRVEQPIPTPAAGQVLIKVHACGSCHSDHMTAGGHYPGLTYPRVPGHEVAGTVAAVGENVKRVSVGQRVGLAWCGDFCGECSVCETGDFVNCKTGKVTGLHLDGGYAEYLLASAHSVARLPDDLSFEELAPLMCAGITVFNSLRNHAPKLPATVAVHGIGGLGHLAIQYAAKMGYQTVALSRGTDKQELAMKLGAHVYIDSTDAAAANAKLQELGGASIIITTTVSAASIGPLIGGLGVSGKIIVVGADHNKIDVTPISLIPGNKSLVGWASGGPRDSEDTAKFSSLHGIKPQVEVFPLHQAQAAYDRMMSGAARFRVVLDCTKAHP